MIDRYLKNIGTLSIEESEDLINHTVCVVGCGGLGGYIIEMLGRIGIGRIIAVDGDDFDESNLNRQILSNQTNIGENKAKEAGIRMSEINDIVELKAITENLTEINGAQIIPNAEVIVDALDNIETRLLLERLCKEYDKPLVHGAVSGWYGQVTTVLPGDASLSKMYKGMEDAAAKLSNISFTPALVAAFEVAEVIKLIIKRGRILSRKLLMIDLLNQELQEIDL